MSVIYWHRITRYDYDQCGGFGHGWQACAGHDAIAPERVFQWEAMGDIPDQFLRYENGVWWIQEPYRVRLIPAPYHLRGFGIWVVP